MCKGYHHRKKPFTMCSAYATTEIINTFYVLNGNSRLMMQSYCSQNIMMSEVCIENEVRKQKNN